MFNFGIFPLLVQCWSFVDSFPLNKSIEVTLRMEVVLFNKSIGVPLLDFKSESDFSSCIRIYILCPNEETTVTPGMSHLCASIVPLFDSVTGGIRHTRRDHPQSSTGRDAQHHRASRRSPSAFHCRDYRRRRSCRSCLYSTSHTHV